jgi:hypothetical protein
MKMTPLRRKYTLTACAGLFALGVAMLLHGQSSPNGPNVASLRQELRAHYNIVALQDELALVPRERNADIKIVEIRDGVVSINGSALTAREARQRLGKDADLIFRVTYLDPAAQRDLARADSAAPLPDVQEKQENNDQPDSFAPPRTQARRGDIVRIGGNVTVARGDVVSGDVVAIGGSADVDGEVTRGVTVVGGSLSLGPDAIVREDVTVIGGTLNRAPGSRIDGKVDNVGFGPNFAVPQRAAGRFRVRNLFSRASGFFGTVLRTTLLILFGLVVVVLGGRFIDAIAERTASEPLRSGFTGLLAEMLFVPLVVLTIVVLAVSIVGIPLLLLVPFAVALAVVLMIIGFTGVACLVGRFVSQRIGIARNPYLSVAVGVLAVLGVTLIAKLCAFIGGIAFGMVIGGALSVLGFLAEYLAWTVGIGALILTWLGRRHRGHPAAPAGTVAAPAPSGPAPA